jgi:glucose-1-phosphate thymidylyltransferase
LKAIIPAAGIGTRLRPHTYTLPKALLFVAGKPIISHILDDVLALGPSSIVLIVGYLGDLIETYVKKAYPDIKVDFVYQEERRGIAHAVEMTRAVANSGEPLLIVLGDTIIKTDLKKITECSVCALGAKEVEDPRRFGVAEVEGGFITRLVEKPAEPKSNLALVGLYYLQDSNSLFDAIKHIIDNDITTKGEYQITDALQLMIERGEKFEPFTIDEWFDCGKPEAMLETNRKLLDDVSGSSSHDGSVIIPPVSISPDAEIVNCIVGPHVSIAANAVVHNTIVRDSIIADGATVKDTVIEESLIGPNAVVDGTFNKLDVGDSSNISTK